MKKKKTPLYNKAYTWLWWAGTTGELDGDGFEYIDGLTPAEEKRLLGLEPELQKILDKAVADFNRAVEEGLDGLGI